MVAFPSLESVSVRYQIACDMKQVIDRERIVTAITLWQSQLTENIVPIRMAVTTEELWESVGAAGAVGDARDARAAWAAWAAWAARDARDAWNAWSTRAARAAWAARAARDARAARAARAARDARAAGDARNAWNARDAWDAWDASYISGIVLGAIEFKDVKVYETWYPLLEAFEAGAWMLYITENEVVVAIIPSRIELDNERRLHSTDVPAFEWLDAKDYYWHGMEVPEQLIMHPETITVEQINDEVNSELRRVMIERYGEGRYLMDSGSQEVAADSYGTLYRKELAGDEPLVMVRVINSTAEPDGSYKHYFIRVDPRAYGGDAGKIPHAAVASTWRRKDMKTLYFQRWQDYQPVFES